MDGWLGVVDHDRARRRVCRDHDRPVAAARPEESRRPRSWRPYECGMPAVGDARERHSVKFYLVAMIFLLFDIEIAFLYPWALALRDLGWSGFFQILTFFLILLGRLRLRLAQGRARLGPGRARRVRAVSRDGRAA